MTQSDRQKLREVPSRLTWFTVGAVLGAPLMFSFGNMVGREWYGRKRRQAQRLEDAQTEQAGVSEFLDLRDFDTPN